MCDKGDDNDEHDDEKKHLVSPYIYNSIIITGVLFIGWIIFQSGSTSEKTLISPELQKTQTILRSYNNNNFTKRS